MKIIAYNENKLVNIKEGDTITFTDKSPRSIKFVKIKKSLFGVGKVYLKIEDN